MSRILVKVTGYSAYGMTLWGHRVRRLLLHALLLLGALGGVRVAPPNAPLLPSPAVDAPVVIHSWQVAHPVLSGVFSGLAWGRWPTHFGADARSEAVQFVQRQGYGLQAFTYVQRLNRPLFRAGQGAGGLLLYSVVASLLWRGRAPPFGWWRKAAPTTVSHCG